MSQDAPTSSKRLFFPGLDEVRGLAALSVAVHHVALYQNRDGIPGLYRTFAAPCVSRLGANGVSIFFVLSGFLITYLLLTEKQRFGTIQLARFYMRRVLRIWPLYFLVVVLSFLILPILARSCEWLQGERHYNLLILDLASNPWPRALLFIFFLPNLALRVGRPVVGGAQAWSVGVEEQFYAVWPLLVKRLSERGVFICFLLLGFIYPLSPLVLGYLSPALAGWLEYLVKLFPVHLMALGACAAHLLFFHESAVRFLIRSRLAFAANTLALLYLLWIDVSSIVFGVIVAIEIVFVVQGGFRFNLRNQWLAKMGTISYGFYMLHPTVMFLSFGLINSVLNVPRSGFLYQFLSYLFVIGGSLIVSQLSYVALERRFVRMKDRRYSVVPSGRVG